MNSSWMSIVGFSEAQAEDGAEAGWGDRGEGWGGHAVGVNYAAPDFDRHQHLNLIQSVFNTNNTRLIIIDKWTTWKISSTPTMLAWSPLTSELHGVYHQRPQSLLDHHWQVNYTKSVINTNNARLIMGQRKPVITSICRKSDCACVPKLWEKKEIKKERSY